MEEDDVGQYYQPANDKTGCYSATVLKCHSATTSKCQTSPVDAQHATLPLPEFESEPKSGELLFGAKCRVLDKR